MQKTITNSMLILGMVLLSFVHLQSQDCSNPILTNGAYLHGNNIRALYAATGSQFWDGSDSQYHIDDPLGAINTIFAHGLWIAGLDPAANLKLSASLFGAAAGNSDYYPGPVDDNASVSPEVCNNYDRAWSVYRYQIEAHQADFADNGIIDTPIAEVMGWPGRGNPQFEAIAGFSLPDTPQGLAPFLDINENGTYDPQLGEYPVEPRHSLVPEHMVWTIFNDIGNTANESGSPLAIQAEIQCVSWAFNCADNPLLNNTIFSSFKIINRAIEPLSSMWVGLWTDFDLGCFTDDYIGSAPAQNTYFAYNADNHDDNPCLAGIAGAGENPPVQAITFLNRSLDGFIYTNNGGVGNPPPGTTDPNSSMDYLNLLQARFIDGSAINEGGDGYDPDGTSPVNHVFPGDPNDPNAWSAFGETIVPTDWRTIGSTAVGQSWEPGAVINLDVAYSYHRQEGADHLQNVTAMYEGVAALQSLYDEGFTSACTQPIVCEGDCIWAGDLNADGIANHEDAIALGFGLNETGTDRLGPYNWTPQDGDSWLGTQIFGTDKKHLDANGDGSCTEADLEKTIQHYNLTRPDYEAVFNYPIGQELAFSRLGGNPELTGLQAGETFFGRANLAVIVPDLRALAFTVEYDPEFYDRFNAINANGGSGNFLILNDEVEGQIDYGFYLNDPNETVGPGSLITFDLKIRSDFPIDFPHDETFIRFRNIRGFLSDGTEVDLGAANTLVQVDGVVATEEPGWGQTIRLFPNPVADRLQLQTGSTIIDAVHLFDGQGKRLQQPTMQQQFIDVKALPAGMYYLRLFSGGDFVIRKFVKL